MVKQLKKDPGTTDCLINNAMSHGPLSGTCNWKSKLMRAYNDECPVVHRQNFRECVTRKILRALLYDDPFLHLTADGAPRQKVAVRD